MKEYERVNPDELISEERYRSEILPQEMQQDRGPYNNLIDYELYAKMNCNTLELKKK